MLWPVLGAIVLVLAVWWAAGGCDPLDALPGPPQHPVIGNILTFIRRPPGDLFVMVREFSEKYGDRYVVRIFRRRILHIVNPQDAEIVLSHSKNITKSKPYTFLRPWLGTGLLLSTEKNLAAATRILFGSVTAAPTSCPYKTIQY